MPAGAPSTLLNICSKIANVGKICMEEGRSAILKSHKWGGRSSEDRIMFVGYASTPTLQLSFLKPLEALFSSGNMVAELLSEQQILFRFAGHRRQGAIRQWIEWRIMKFQPTVIILCRYSGRYAKLIVEHARSRGIRTVFHIDDDLLNVPIEIGQKKFEYHNHPMRIESVRYLLRSCDLVYCSTFALKERLSIHGEPLRFVAGDIYCAAAVRRRPMRSEAKTIGYMGFDHDHDFSIALPAIVAIMHEYPNIKFEIFGSIKRPAALDQFGSRLKMISIIRDYDDFMEKLAARGWDIGICPLANTSFNALKANTKWVEYTAAGIAVIASGETIYDVCCRDGCGVLASSTDDWKTSFERLIVDNDARFEVVSKAQARLEKSYSIDILRQQVMEILRLAREMPSNLLSD